VLLAGGLRRSTRGSGTAPEAAAGALAFFAIALGAALEGLTLFLAARPEGMAPLVAIGVLGFGVDYPARWAQSQPVLFVLAALVVGTFLLYHTCGVGAIRERIFRPTYSIINSISINAKRRFAEEVAASRAARGGVWRRGALGGDIAGWVRAANYERYGDSTLGLLRDATLIGFFATVMVAVFSFQTGFAAHRSRVEGLDVVYRAIFAPRPAPRGTCRIPPGSPLG